MKLGCSILCAKSVHIDWRQGHIYELALSGLDSPSHHNARVWPLITHELHRHGRSNTASVACPAHNNTENSVGQKNIGAYTAMKTWKTNSVLLSNGQIHDIAGQISPSYVFGHHGSWPSLSNPKALYVDNQFLKIINYNCTLYYCYGYYQCP